MHWVTLFDSLDDDLFEGQLGIDDGYYYPKALIEYSIVSSKFTSMYNDAEDIGEKINKVRLNRGVSNKDPSAKSAGMVASDHRSQRSTAKAVKMVTLS